MRAMIVSLLWLVGANAFAQVPAQFVAADTTVVLNENSCWLRYLRFAPNRFSPAILKAQGQHSIDATRYGKLKENSEKWMRASGLDPTKVDWRDHAVLVA